MIFWRKPVPTFLRSCFGRQRRARSPLSTNGLVTRQERDLIERDHAMHDDRVEGGEDDACHQCRGQHLRQELWRMRGALRRAGRHLSLFFLSAYADRQHGEEYDPPDEEIEGDAKGERHDRITLARARPACRRSPWGGETT